MFKRLAGGLLLTLGLTVTSLGLLVGSAAADPASNAYPPSTPAPAFTRASTHTTDPCLVGNGTTGTTNGNCFPAQPAATTAAASNTATALQTPGTSAGSSLAFTGTDVIGTVIVAFALIGGGILVVRMSRRRHTA